jgi:acyl-CoA thioester hydrolase
VSALFRVRLVVRGYELDSRGVLAGAGYHQYGEHARAECLRAAGVSAPTLDTESIALVTLETTVRFRRDLRDGDEVTVSCAFAWRPGKTFRIDQEIRRRDGTMSAELTSLAGLLDVTERKLVADPAARLRAIARDPATLGL